MSDELDDLLAKLDAWCRAYPEDVFPPPNPADLEWLHATKPGLCDEISASMGRHMVKHMREMAEVIRRRTTLRDELAELADRLERVPNTPESAITHATAVGCAANIRALIRKHYPQEPQS